MAALVMLVLLTSPGPIPDGACASWQGRLWGNDNQVKTRLWLCRRRTERCGTLSWSSETSGENVRQLSGAVHRGGYRLRDVAFLRNEPRPGWRFCLIDWYHLAPDASSGGLRGRYRSRACADEALIALEPAPSSDIPPSCLHLTSS